MEKATLEDVIQRLDRLEKMITEVNEQLWRVCLLRNWCQMLPKRF